MSLQIFGCPDCEQPFQVDSSQAGQQVRCPGCRSVVQIPEVLGHSPETGSADLTQPPEPPATQEAPESFACPACDSLFGVLASMYGTSMACPHCGQAVAIERKPTSPAPVVEEEDFSLPNVDVHGLTGPPQKKKRRPKPKAQADVNAGPSVTTDKPTAGSAGTPLTKPQTTDESNLFPVEEQIVTVFEPQKVDHLLPPRFATLDPAFFYRHGNSTDQVLLPQADGSVQAVSNRIVTVVHNGQEYQLISSPRYRRNLDIIVNTVLILIAAVLMMAIWLAVA